MNFIKNHGIRNISSIRFLLLLLLLVITQSLPTLTITDSEGRECRDITLHLINETFPATVKCSTEAEWSIQPTLPKGISTTSSKNQLLISGFSKVALPKTTFTVTAITKEGNVSITFNLTCVGCEEGDMYEISARGLIRFSFEGENIDISNNCWQCMKRVVYSYASLENNSRIYMKDIDDNYVMYFSEMNETTGEIDLSGNSPPILFFPDRLQSYKYEILLLFSFSFVHRITNFTLYPPHPDLKLTPGSLMVLVSGFYESNHIITVSNDHGSVSQLFHIIVNGCSEGLYYDIRHTSWGQTTVVDSLNNTVYSGLQNYFCTSDTNLTLYFNEEKWGIELMRPLFIYDQHGMIAEFNTDSVPATFHFYKQDLVPTFSTLRISDSLQNNWNSVNFDDSLWKEGQGQMWGSFHKDTVYFRKQFTIYSITNLNTILIDILAFGEVDVYLNGEYVNHIYGKLYNTYTRLEVPLKESHIGENVLAVSLHKTTDEIINFDIMIQLVLISQRLQSILGEVTQEVAIPSPNPFNAFTQSGYYEWIMQSVPATLVFRFNDTEKRIVNRVYFQVPRDNFITKVQVDAVNFNENKNITLYSSPNDFMNRFMKYRVIDFDNSIAYPAYRITFESTSSTNSTKIENLRLYRDMIPSCPQTKKYPETRGGKTIFSNCGLFKTGKQQNRCVIDDAYTTHWEEDRSTCLSMLPNRNFAFVDFTLQLFHVIPSMFNSTMEEQLKMVLIETTAVRPDEVSIIYIMDSSDTENSSINIFMRISVKQAGGDYIAEQLSDMKYDISNSIHKYMAEEFDGMIIGKIRIYISLKPEILIIILILILIVVFMTGCTVYGISAYIRDRKRKTKSLKRITKTNEEILLNNQELTVCC